MAGFVIISPAENVQTSDDVWGQRQNWLATGGTANNGSTRNEMAAGRLEQSKDG